MSTHWLTRLILKVQTNRQLQTTTKSNLYAQRTHVSIAANVNLEFSSSNKNVLTGNFLYIKIDNSVSFSTGTF